MQSEKESLQAILTGAVAAVGYEMLGFEYQSQGKGALLRIYIDSENGIGLEDCQKASRQIGAVLDVDDTISNRYTLEVSSPGLERPLFTLEQYKRFIGKTVKLQLHLAREERYRFTGLLLEVDDEGVVLELNGEAIGFLLSDIKKANLVFDV